MIPSRSIQQELEDEIINYVHQAHYESFECNGSYGTELVTKKRKVKRLFDILYESFSKLEGNKSSQRNDLKAWNVLKSNEKLLKIPKTIGPVDGVEVGDRFDFRLQLMIMGIHSFIIRGIDYIQLAHGQLLATCVVATEGYFDKMVMQEEILYTGEGGTFDPKGKDVKDQELKRGNLALKNSMDAQNYVRVVRGIKSSGKKSTTFIYDGLYKVVECYKERAFTLILMNILPLFNPLFQLPLQIQPKPSPSSPIAPPSGPSSAPGPFPSPSPNNSSHSPPDGSLPGPHSSASSSDPPPDSPSPATAPSPICGPPSLSSSPDPVPLHVSYPDSGPAPLNASQSRFRKDGIDLSLFLFQKWILQRR
ncbi:hypothetical protein BVRB_9g225690 [Beta vulgaris subsp. vulgaris]|uniref:YDG domain-containing protein n=1 Tax=Beta vulgaris subsp. vulgaris TaxID=3555 RepID=A0A0J8B8T5_BETVV|nr:hypothetical protein BVRB_9g225690 [Beta vulgaris subsp. vulgaris]